MDKKLKIALGTDAFPPNVDGIVYTVMNYANYLQKMGCDVTVVTPENPAAGKDRYPFHVYRYQNLKIPKDSVHAHVPECRTHIWCGRSK